MTTTSFSLNLSTVLNILFANGMENVVALAVRLDAGIADKPAPQSIVVEVDKDMLAKAWGMQPVSKDLRWRVRVSCTVIAFDHYRLAEPFLVTLPDGTTRWTADTDMQAHDLEYTEERKATMLAEESAAGVSVSYDPRDGKLTSYDNRGREVDIYHAD